MNYKAYALLGILLASFASVSATSAVFAQSAMTVKTDKSSYTTGDTIMVSGSVGPLANGQNTAVIKVSSPKGIYRIEPITVGSDGSFTYSFKVGGALGVSGQYTIQITYNNQQQTANFNFTGTTGGGGQQPGQWQSATVTIAGQSYTIRYQISGGGTVSSISATPDTQTLNITLANAGNGKLTLELPRNVIDAKSGNGTDDSFAVFIDDTNADYNETTTNSSVRVIDIPLEQGATTVEVVGTFMVPEFGAIAAIVLAVAIVGIIVATTRYSNKFSFLPKL